MKRTSKRLVCAGAYYPLEGHRNPLGHFWAMCDRCPRQFDYWANYGRAPKHFVAVGQSK